MAQAAVAADLHQPLDVHGNLATQIAFHLDVVVDVVAQLADILFGQVLDARIRVDAGRFDDIVQSSAACRRYTSARSQRASHGAGRHQRFVPWDECTSNLLSLDWFDALACVKRGIYERTPEKHNAFPGAISICPGVLRLSAASGILFQTYRLYHIIHASANLDLATGVKSLAQLRYFLPYIRILNE